MERRPSTQDVTWFLDLHRNNQLDLSPPYQRRSVWTRRDKEFFIDTIFRRFPSPAIYLHKSIDDSGQVTYHVVDGKQRLETILTFARDGVRVSKEFGDVRLDGKKWSELQGETTLKQTFWNYAIPVEMLDTVEGSIVNEVFDRLNRNSRKLTRQELRHARFDGWFITTVEAESTKPEWKELGVVTTARAKRMTDSQAISELLLVLLERRVFGFDQDVLDDYYATYEDPDERLGFSEVEFNRNLETFKSCLLQIERESHAVTTHAGSVANFYTLWATVTLAGEALPADTRVLAARYKAFMEKVEVIGQQEDIEAFLGSADALPGTMAYWNNIRGANTDLKPREARLEALLKALQRQNS